MAEDEVEAGAVVVDVEGGWKAGAGGWAGAGAAGGGDGGETEGGDAGAAGAAGAGAGGGNEGGGGGGGCDGGGPGTGEAPFVMKNVRVVVNVEYVVKGSLPGGGAANVVVSEFPPALPP